MGFWSADPVVGTGASGGIPGMDAYLAAIPAAEKTAGLPVGSLKGILAGEATPPGITSSAGAITPFQITSPAAQDIGMDMTLIAKDPTAAANTSAGYLAKQLKQFGNLKDAYAAYNAGPGGAFKWIAAGRPDDGFGGVGSYVKRASSAAGLQVAQATASAGNDATKFWSNDPVIGGQVESPLSPSPPAGPASASTGSAIKDALWNAATGAELGASRLVGLPKSIGELVSAGASKLPESVQKVLPHIPMDWAPSAEGTQTAIERATGFQPYAPSTPEGRIFQEGVAGTIGGAPGGPLGMLMGGLGGGGMQVAKEAGAGPGTQLAVGLGLPLLTGAGLPALARGLRAISPPLTKAAQAAKAAEIVGPGLTGVQRPTVITGTPQTLGMATGNPQTLAIERAAFQRTPEMAAKLKDIQSKTQEAANTNLRSLGNLPGPGENTTAAQAASAEMRGNVDAAAQAAKDAEQKAWAAVPKNVAIDAPSIRLDINKYIGERPIRAAQIPSYVTDWINATAPAGPGAAARIKSAPLQAVIDLRSQVLSDGRAAAQSGNRNYKSILDDVAGILQKHIDAAVAPDAAGAQALTAARQASRDYHAQFGDPTTQRILKTDLQGTPIISPSQSAGRYLNNTPEGVSAYLKATGGMPESIQAARDYLVAQLKSAAETTPGTLKPFGKYLDSHAPMYRDSRIFTPDQQSIMQRSADALDRMSEQSKLSAVAGSDTYSKFATGDYMKAFVGEKALGTLKLLGGLVGLSTHGPIGAVGGYVAAGKIAGLYKSAGEKIMKMVDETLADPSKAAELARFIKRPNAATLTPRLRLLFGVAAGPAAGTQP